MHANQQVARAIPCPIYMYMAGTMDPSIAETNEVEEISAFQRRL
jgi:hypothetical protein